LEDSSELGQIGISRGYIQRYEEYPFYDDNHRLPAVLRTFQRENEIRERDNHMVQFMT
jgi:hypothetical protein